MTLGSREVSPAHTSVPIALDTVYRAWVRDCGQRSMNPRQPV